MDKYESVRRIPLRDVLAQFGFTAFKKRAGKSEWYGACVFHDAKQNKTSFSFTDEKFNCFSCGEHGSGAIDLVMKLKKVGFQEAVALLQGTTANRVDRDVLHGARHPEPSESAPLLNKAFEGRYEKFYVPSDWLKARGLSEESLKLYGVGQYLNPARKSAYSNKVLFPILRFADGVKTGYLARTIEEGSRDPKYIFPSGFHKSLEMFGAWQLKQQLAQAQGPGRIKLGLVVESPLCVLKFSDYGFPAVSPFGWSLSEAQLEILQSLFVGVLYLPDRNKYGECAKTAYEIAQRLWMKSPTLPDGIDDPEVLTQSQVLQLMKSVSL